MQPPRLLHIAWIPIVFLGSCAAPASDGDVTPQPAPATAFPSAQAPKAAGAVPAWPKDPQPGASSEPAASSEPRSASEPTAPAGPGSPSGPAAPSVGPPRPAAYDPGSGRFVVHEWGTFTNVVGSDGVLLPGLQHEEEDLPGFVADRLAQAHLIPQYVSLKMETPVTYFYAPGPRVVKASVRFPKGVFSQWYPYVKAAAPQVFQPDPNDPSSLVDPYLMSLPPPVVAEMCNVKIEANFGGGLLDWGEIEILARDEQVPLPGPLGDTTWRFSRQTAANPLRVRFGATAHHEKFLFYRGLGRFELPMSVGTAERGATFAVPANPAAHSMRGALLLNVDARGGGLVKLGDIAAGGRGLGEIPAPVRPHADFVRDLRATLEATLVSEGLYTDEARAMIDTWERSYFLTPGPRLLYVLPRELTDQIIPLDVSPKPDETVRVMVIRVELLTPAAERELAADLEALGNARTKAAARARFLQRGRFAEPHLVRALALPYADPGALPAGRALLDEIRGRRRWASLAVQ